jgi:hypothetical protein
MLPAMERSESVNLGDTLETPDFEEADSLAEGAGAAQRVPVADQGPCLYLGPSGQRCGRRAVAGSFCARHQPGTSQTLSLPQISRRSVAVIGLLAVLWPVLADLIRELVRLLR